MFKNGTAVLEKPESTAQNSHNSGQSRRHQDTKGQDTFEKIKNFRVEFGPSTKDILHFTNQLSVMIRAGISIQEALESIGQQQKNEKFKTAIIDIKEKIESGYSFSQALAEYPNIFSNLYINMVAAAEISGSLSKMLEKLAGYLDQEADTHSQIKGAMIYPAIIAFMAISVTIFLLTFVLPRFYKIFAGKEHLLPVPTKLLMASSDFLRSNWIYIIIVVAAAGWGFCYLINTKPGRKWWDNVKLILPIIKTLCRSLYINRSLHTMGVLTTAGVPILDTISITAQIAGNVHFKNMWMSVHEEVRQGKKIASSLNQFKLMPPDVVQMIRSGENSGTMGSVLADVAEFYGRELKTVIKAVTSMIEPIMIVLMGVLVGFIAMSIMLPIFKMSSLVSGK
jgi:type IV pilus assembly protein PilC